MSKAVDFIRSLAALTVMGDPDFDLSGDFAVPVDDAMGVLEQFRNEARSILAEIDGGSN